MTTITTTTTNTKCRNKDKSVKVAQCPFLYSSKLLTFFNIVLKRRRIIDPILDAFNITTNIVPIVKTMTFVGIITIVLIIIITTAAAAAVVVAAAVTIDFSISGIHGSSTCR